MARLFAQPVQFYKQMSKGLKNHAFSKLCLKVFSSIFSNEEDYLDFYFIADVPYLEGCSVIHLKEKWITVECLLNQEETLSGDKKEGDELEYW